MEMYTMFYRSKLRVEDLREMQQVNKEAQWTSDRDAVNCKLCTKPFSVARRKVGRIVLYSVSCNQLYWIRNLLFIKYNGLFDNLLYHCRLLQSQLPLQYVSGWLICQGGL